MPTRACQSVQNLAYCAIQLVGGIVTGRFVS